MNRTVKPVILIIDDDPDITTLVAETLGARGIDSVTVGCGREAEDVLARQAFAAIVLDLGLPDVGGEELLARIRQRHPNTPVVVLSAETDVSRVVSCMQNGAHDFLNKSFEPLRWITSVRNAIEQGKLRRRIEDLVYERAEREGMPTLLGNSESMRKVVSMLMRCARSDVTVLLTGESGTGKEVAARAIHSESQRSEAPFLAVNCGAIPEGVIESELFGHERGAFTGADSARRGVFEEAAGGTLFLDEIGELRVDLQVRLLRVLQERQVQRVGSSVARDVDVRVVAATNRDLPERVQKGEFREDLYYRLAVFPVEMPPLRERGDDVLLLAKAFLDRHDGAVGRRLRGWTRSAADALLAHRWPGNVRELQNVIERATILEDTDHLTVWSLPTHLQQLVDVESLESYPVEYEPEAIRGSATISFRAGEPAVVEQPVVARVVEPDQPEADDEDEAVEPFEVQERRIFERALDACGWNIREVSRRLGIGRATVYRKIDKYGLDNGRVGDREDDRTDE